MLSPEETRELISSIRRPHPDEHLGISLPGFLNHEKNRQARIRHWDYHHPEGWTPCGDNWWMFRQTRQQFEDRARDYLLMNERLREQLKNVNWGLSGSPEQDQADIDEYRERVYGETVR